jgi:SAM-dependent methyltransferase
VKLLRRAFRRLFPRRLDPVMDATLVRSAEDERCAAIYRATVPEGDPFVLGRFDEALRWRHVLDSFAGREGCLLDLGAGNGAVELAFVSAGRTIVGVDPIWNETARQLHRAAGLPLRRVVAAAEALPFRDGTFAHALCLETVEHLARPHEAGREMMRVVGGTILLTTPPRLRYLLAPDPHFGIRGLLLLPARLQERVAARRGFRGPHHYVDRIYWTVGQIAAMFPFSAVERIYTRSRLPRRLFWDAVVLRRMNRL